MFKPEALLNAEMGSWLDRTKLALEAKEVVKGSVREKGSVRGGQVAWEVEEERGWLNENREERGFETWTFSGEALFVVLSEEELSRIDMRATPDTRLTRLVFKPTPELGAKEAEKPEPRFRKPKYNSHIAKISSSPSFSPERILQDLRILTGESPQPKSIGEWHSRHSSTYGARRAGRWIKGQLEESLAALNGSCDFWEYSPYFSPNIVCHLPGTDPSAEIVLISAHYDSRGSFGSTTAPGGDDDGSGTAALLSIARALSTSPLSLTSPVQLVAFSGEEQGLVGSQKYSSHLHSSDVPIKLALQMDMLAYRLPGEPMQIAFPDKLSTTTATEYVWQIADIYQPQLEQGYTPACCSDHQSFWEVGYPATWVFERNGPIADPMYHNSGDVTEREGYDVEQLASIAKVVLATLLDVAGFES